MNDFDFDELDKAVSSLATKTVDEHGQPVDPPQPTPAAPVAPQPAPEPAAPATPPTVTPAKHPPRLSGDRPQPRRAFMDIKPPQKPLSRMGATLQPINKDIAPEPPKPEAPKLQTPPAPQSETEQSTAPQQPVAVEPSESKPFVPAEPPKHDQDVAWPDPLDFHDTPEKPTEPQPEVKESKEEPEQPPTEQTEPASATPFLAEAKVEKRPLGAYSNFKPAENAPSDELTPEADGTFKEPNATAPSAAPLPPDRHESATEEPANDMHQAAMMSIPKQYHAEDKPPDNAPRPVFDTKEYHPPLLEATNHERRGSMWGKLFIALIVLVILGAAGYFAYVYVMAR